MTNVQLAHPAWLILLVLMLLPWLRQLGRPRLIWPMLSGFAEAPRGWALVGKYMPPLLRSVAFGCLAVALARPQTVAGRIRVSGQGVAIVAALDRSPSMNAEDFLDPVAGRTSRLDAAVGTLIGFVEGRPDDLIGLVAFARHPDLVCPPTLDHGFLNDAARALRPARPDESGTNIGDAIALALDALLQTQPAQKVVVLLTDGRNQAEGIVPRPLSPREAAELARDLGITLHTIAVGRSGILRVQEEITGLDRPVAESEGPDLESPAELARIGGGRAFVAGDASALEAVFREIDQLERSPVEGLVRTRYRDWYPYWIAAAVVLLTADRLLSMGRLRRLPG